VSAYDALGTVMGMPVGALVAGPIAAAIGVSATQYGAAGLMIVATALALIPRDIRTMRSGSPAAAGSGPVAREPASIPDLESLPDPAVVADEVLAEAAFAKAPTR